MERAAAARRRPRRRPRRPRGVRRRLPQRRLRRPRPGRARHRASSTRPCSARTRSATSPGCCAAARAPPPGLARNEVQLRDLVGNLATTAGALAAEQAALRRRRCASWRRRSRRPAGALDALDAAFPATRAWAREILPGVRETAAVIDAARPWIREVRALLRADELRRPRGASSRPLGRDLATLTEESLALLPRAERTARCARDVVLPTGERVIRDEFSTGEENYKELFYGLVGLTGEGQNFDGNGQYVRFQTGGGDNVIRLGQSSLGGPPQFGALPVTQLGTRPRFPGRKPPLPPGRAVRRAGPAGAERPGRRARPGLRSDAVRAVRAHLADVLAIVALVAVAAVVGARHPGQPAPRAAGLGAAHRPGRGGDRGRARQRPVRHAGPGADGQRGRRAGGGDLGGPARARPGDRHAAHRRAPTCRSTRTRASCCARGPGCATWWRSSTRARPRPGRCAEGRRIPIGRTLPDVTLDEILAALDADTRASLQRPARRGRARAAPAARAGQHAAPHRADRARPAPGRARRWPQRRRNLARAIHILSLLLGELGGRDDQLATLVDSSNAVFASLARQEASLRATLRALPGTLARPQTALGRVRRRSARSSGRRCRRCGRPRGRSGRRCGGRAPSSADAAGRARADPPVRARGAAHGARAAARRARPRGLRARPHALARRASRPCSTRSPTTRRGSARRATCSGSRGSTTSATRCSRTPTRTARSAAAS